MKEVLRSENLFYLRVLQQTLEDHDINSFIMDEHSGTLMSGIGNILPRLMVLDEDYEIAVTAIKDAEEKQ